MKSDTTTLRVLLDVIILACILAGWWFVALPLALLAAWWMPFYIELIIFGFIYDALYGMGHGLGVFGFLGIIVTLVFALVIGLFKMLVK